MPHALFIVSWYSRRGVPQCTAALFRPEFTGSSLCVLSTCPPTTKKLARCLWPLPAVNPGLEPDPVLLFVPCAHALFGCSGAVSLQFWTHLCQTAQSSVLKCWMLLRQNSQSPVQRCLLMALPCRAVRIYNAPPWRLQQSSVSLGIGVHMVRALTMDRDRSHHAAMARASSFWHGDCGTRTSSLSRLGVSTAWFARPSPATDRPHHAVFARVCSR